MEDEFSLIQKITPAAYRHSSLQVGIGDDAAVYSTNENYDQLVCIDTMVEDVHFRRDTMPPEAIGHKGLAANLSDLAAMGGIPLYYLVSIALPKYWHAQWERLYDGMEKLAKRYDVELIGGDTTASQDRLTLTVVVIGCVEKGQALLRSNARPNDVIFLTGRTGLSAAGLEVLISQKREEDWSDDDRKLVTAHQWPKPRVEYGRLFVEKGFRAALNDISDGIANEANEIAAASGVTLKIEEEKLPRHPALQMYSPEKQIKWMLSGGEDFELLGTISKKQKPQLASAFAERGWPLTFIGEVHEGPAEVWLTSGNKNQKLTRSGYHHFR